jgi:uncharacterized protein YacL
MNISLSFLRTLFFVLSIFFMTTYMLSSPTGTPHENALWGIILGSLFGCLLIGFDTLFKKFNLRSFNIAIIGIFIGYLMGEALLLVFKAIVDISSISIHASPQILEIIKIALFLFGTYLGTIMTLKASDEFYVSIPFVKFAPTSQKKKDLLIDSSALADARLIDLVATGLFDHQLILPRFLIKELYAQSEIGDELAKLKAKKSLELIKKLESLEALNLRFNDTDFPEVKDPQGKLIRLARLLDANILSADISRIQMSSLEGIKVINMHSLSSALKPLTQTGEYIKIKIQRYGKEPRQGIGYLEEGTMVVVNGGGKYIGETIDAQVLSVKHTSSGRMIFCNACDETGLPQDFEHEADSYDEHK